MIKEFQPLRVITETPEFDLENPADSKMTLLVGAEREVPIVISSQQKIHARFVVYTSATGIVKTRQENSKLVIKGVTPGRVILTLLVTDKMVPLITGDPEEDNPLEIEVKVF